MKRYTLSSSFLGVVLSTKVAFSKRSWPYLAACGPDPPSFRLSGTLADRPGEPKEKNHAEDAGPCMALVLSVSTRR